MKFTDSNGVPWTDIAICAQCGFESADTGLFRCPADGAILGEVTRRTASASALAAQAMFEAMFDHQPMVDLTLPAVPSPTAAERATWRVTS
jgi:hypothetical protein